MKTSKKILSILIAMAAILPSCDYTDLDPSDMVGKDQAFKDVAAVGTVINGTYSLMSLEATLGLAEVIADDVVQGGQAGGRGTDSYMWTYSSSSADQKNYWEKRYSTINLANRVLFYGGDVVPANSTEQTKLNDYLGSAHFIRAYAHFDLLRFYSNFKDESTLGVPYMLKPHLFEQPRRNKVSECYQYIMDDLQKAEDLLANDKPSDVAYASKTAVNALRARVALYRMKYDDAYTYATAALQNVPLVSASEYANIWTDKSSGEIILKLPRKAGQTYIGGLFIAADNSNIFSPSLSYINSYTEPGDIRKNLFITRGPDREGNIVNIVKKYIGTAENVGLNDEKILRSAEMKLIEIEALIYKNRVGDANSELNKFRALRIEGWVDKTYSSDALKEEVLLERRRELSFEGQRFFDLRRYNKDIVRDNVERVLRAGDYRFVQPIPLSEMEANEGIPKADQNPGY